MAWFSYTCETHGDFKTSLEKRESTQKCPKCQVNCRGIIKAGTSRTVERLDNGAMGRAVERLHNIEEIMSERDANHSIQQDEEE